MSETLGARFPAGAETFDSPAPPAPAVPEPEEVMGDGWGW